MKSVCLSAGCALAGWVVRVQEFRQEEVFFYFLHGLTPIMLYFAAR